MSLKLNLILILYQSVVGIEVSKNPLCNLKEPKYYHGDTCSKYWLCYEGKEWPPMACPGSEMVYNPIVQRCDSRENSVCPGDDLRGHIEENMIFPELTVHSTCGYRHRNGVYEYHKNRQPFMSLDLCGYKQACTNDGKLIIQQCPNGKLWNNETETCVPTEEMKVCEPSPNWTKQTGIDLEECLGLVDGRCEIGFTELDRAKKYCEYTEECVGIKKMPCNKISVNMDCIGIFWRPFVTFVASERETEAYIFQRNTFGPSVNSEGEKNNTIHYKYNYADIEQFYYAGCADGLYKTDGSCSVKFDTSDQALHYCDKYKGCQGVAREDDSFVAVKQISKDKMHFRETQKRGQVIQKLNKVIKLLLDKRTMNTMLTEPWTNNYAGSLATCTKYENGTCTPIFANLFEAQYYCESLGDDCVGVSETDGEFTTMTKIVGNSVSNSTSSVKAMWCSEFTPLFHVKLPSVFSANNQVRVMWPVIDLEDIYDLMKRSSDPYLSRIHDRSPLTNNQFNRFGLNVTVMADTIVVNSNITFYNIRNFKIIARKLIIRQKSTLTFRQVQISSAWEPLDTASDPDPGNCSTTSQGFCNGINGKNGENGFPATTIELDFGCINGIENSLTIRSYSGDGGKGQHASNGTHGQNGKMESDLEKWADKKNVCGWFDSCGKCCKVFSDETNGNWFAIGHDSRIHGSSGGNGGNGGDGGDPGDLGSITLKLAKGLPQNLRSVAGVTGIPGNGGRPGKPGRRGKGGYGEYLDCNELGTGFRTTCYGHKSTYKEHRGKDGPFNYPGINGTSGNISHYQGDSKIDQLIDTHHVISADAVHQDFMLKYAVMLMNNETINESQEILYYLTKFKSTTSVIANQLLQIMNKDGRLETDVKSIPGQPYEKLHNKLTKIIDRGQQLESVLNQIAEVFNFTQMFNTVADTVLDVVENELIDIRVEKYEIERNVIDSYNSMTQKNLAIEKRQFEIYDDIDQLVFLINMQKNSLYKAEKRKKRMACTSAIFSCIPGIPTTGIIGAVGNTAKALNHNYIMEQLDELECDELHTLSFLNEFIYDFAQLGDDVACLRTPEDFRNFEAGALKSFFTGDLKNMLSDQDMWLDVQCLVGLVPVETVPPNFGFIPSLDDFLDFPLWNTIQNIKLITKVTKSTIQIVKCCKEDYNNAIFDCFITNCGTILDGINALHEIGLDCSDIDYKSLEENIESIKEAFETLEDVINDILKFLNDLSAFLIKIDDVVSEIVYFEETVHKILNLDIFEDVYFQSFIEFFQAVAENVDEIEKLLPDFKFDQFARVAKKINDFLHSPGHEKWLEVIESSIQCKAQIHYAEICLEEILTIDIRGVLQDDVTDFDGIRNEIDKFDCVQEVDYSGCIAIGDLLFDDIIRLIETTDILTQLQNLFGEFAKFLYDIQTRMYDRLDFLEDQHESLPKLCESKQRTEDFTSFTRKFDLLIQPLIDTAQTTKTHNKRHRSSTFGNLGILPIVEIPDYSAEIKQVSSKIMNAIMGNAVESFEKMGFVVTDLLSKQIDLLKIQVRENFFKSLHDRFSAGGDRISNKLDQQVELFQDTYQLYTFTESRAFDAFVQLNNRFEYETLWPYPTGDKLKEILDASESQNFQERLSTFEKFELLNEDFGNVYQDYTDKVSNDYAEVTKNILISDAMLEDFYFSGSFQLHLNPSDQNCMNCFNARLKQVKVLLDGAQLDFNITHLGSEMQIRVEDGFRAVETIKGQPESYSIGSGTFIENFKDRSPFANFFIELKATNYLPCESLATDAEKKDCSYEIRKQIRSMSVEFIISHMPNFPDQRTQCDI